MATQTQRERQEQRGLSSEQARLLQQIADGMQFVQDRLVRLAATDERLAELFARAGERQPQAVPA